MEYKIKKSIISARQIFSALILLFASSLLYAAPDLNAGSASGAPGDNLSIPVNLINNGSVVSLQFDIQYDHSQLTLGSPAAGVVVGTHGFATSTPAAGTLRVVITPTSNNDPIVSGEIVNIPLTINATTTTDQTISITNIVMSNAAATSIAPTIVNNGIISVVSIDTLPPSVPADLIASTISTSQIDLSWSPSIDDIGLVAGYNIYRNANPTPIATVTGTSYSDNGLTANTIYTYSVTAFDNASPLNESLPSTTANATTLAAFDTQPPSIPTGVIATATSGSQVDLSWNASTDNGGGVVSGYKIYRDANTTAIATVTGTSYTDSGLAASTTYNYTIAAIDNATPANESLPSVVISATTPAPTVAERINVGGSSFVDGLGQTWSADTAYNTGNISVTTASINGTTDDALYQSLRWDSGTAPEMQYSIYVPNGNYNVTLHFSENWSGAFSIGARVFDVNIEGVLALDNLDIFSEAGANTALVKTIPVTVTDGQVTIDFIHGIENPMVNAIEIVSTSIVADTQAPSIPTGVTATTTSDRQINLSWTASTDNGGGTVAGYNIYRDGNPTAIATVTSTSYNDMGLTANTNYSYTVSAIDNAIPTNESIPSVSVNATTLTTAAVAIRINVAGNSYVDGLGQTWSADTGYNTGNASVVTAGINGTTEDALYQSNRWDSGTTPELQYSVNVPNGDYNVRLHFSENWSGAFSIGARVFDVNIEGTLALDNLDIFSEVGANTALVKTIPVTVTDGQVTIDFIHGMENPQISAIEIVSTSIVADTQAPSIPTGVTATAISDTQINLSWTASTDNGGGSIAGYKIYRDSNPTAIATVSSTSYNDSGLTANTNYSYTVSAIDNAIPTNESIPSASTNVTTLTAAAVAIRINVAGNSYVDGLGQTWSADTGYNTGNASVVTASINSTTDDTLYQSNRWDSGTVPEMQYNIAVPNGNYNVRLHFSENWSGAFSTGARVFDVNIEGALVLDNLDIFSEVRAKTALVKTIPVTVTDGQLTIDFIHGVENPQVSGIEVLGVN